MCILYSTTSCEHNFLVNETEEHEIVSLPIGMCGSFPRFSMVFGQKRAWANWECNLKFFITSKIPEGTQNK